MRKKGQLEVSFGIVFSIILIIVFVAFAVFVAVKIFLPAKCVTTGLFKTDLQESVDRAWNSEQSSFEIELSLPGEVKKICFIDFNKTHKGAFREEYEAISKFDYKDWNLLFYPTNSACSEQSGIAIKHIDISAITKNSNPYCITNIKGKIKIKIDGYYGKLVKLS